jgi:CIC family chloride channel protein
MLYGRFFYKVRDLFRLLKVPDYAKPAIGGLLVGVIGMFLPQILGMGYGWVQFAIDGNTAILPLGLIIAVAFGKIVATSLSIGSGGSGGVFAPGLVVGGMVGAASWTLLNRFRGLVPADPGTFVILGMMTLFGGIAKAPIAIMIMVSEMTGNYHLLVPSMVSVVIAYFFTGESYIYENQVDSRVDSAAHRTEFSIPLLERIKVADAMATSVVAVPPEFRVSDVSRLMKSNQIDALPVVESGRLVGIVANLDMARLPEDRWQKTTARDIMSKELVFGHAGDTLYDAMDMMNRHNISHLPIVDEDDPGKLVGFLAIHDISHTYDLRKKTISSALQ